MKPPIFIFCFLPFLSLLISLPEAQAHDISQVKSKKFGMLYFIEWRENQEGRGLNPSFDSSEIIAFFGDQIGDKFAFLVESELELDGNNHWIGGEVVNFTVGKAYGIQSILDESLNVSVGIIPVNFGPVVDLHHSYYNNLIGTGVRGGGPYSEEENLNNFFKDAGIALSGLKDNFYYEAGYINGLARDIMEEEEIKPSGFYFRGDYTFTLPLTVGITLYQAQVSDESGGSDTVDREEFYLLDFDYQSKGYGFAGTFMAVRNREADNSRNRGFLFSLENHYDLTRNIFIASRIGLIKPFKKDTVFGVSGAKGGFGGAFQGEFGIGYQLGNKIILKVSYQGNWEESNSIDNDRFFLQFNFVL